MERWKVGILIFDGVAALDVAGPLEVLTRARLEPGVESRHSEERALFDVFTVGRNREPVTATGGLVLLPSHSFADAPHVDLLLVPGGFGTRPLLQDAEVVDWIRRTAANARLTASCSSGLVPGGFGTRPLLQDAEVVDWIRRTAANARLTASVCTGALLLARAGLLDGRRATTHWGSFGLLATLGKDITVDREARFVDDGVLTSAGVASGMDLALHVVETLYGREVADETARYIEYRRG